MNHTAQIPSAALPPAVPARAERSRAAATAALLVLVCIACFAAPVFGQSQVPEPIPDPAPLPTLGLSARPTQDVSGGLATARTDDLELSIEARRLLQSLGISAQTHTDLTSRLIASDDRSRLEALSTRLHVLVTHFFRPRSGPIVHEVGPTLLQEFTDPRLFESMLERFALTSDDAQLVLLEHLRRLGTPESEAAIAFAAVIDRDGPLAEKAAQTLVQIARDRAESGGDLAPPRPVQELLARALARPNYRNAAARAGEIAASLRLLEALPMMIAAQAGRRVGDRDGRGARAFIAITQQTPFIADLNPVVGDNAVAFDPVIGVLTTGTVLSVGQTAVFSAGTASAFNPRLLRATQGLASFGWGGRPVEHLGASNDRWRAWLSGEFKPYRAAVAQGLIDDNADRAVVRPKPIDLLDPSTYAPPNPAPAKPAPARPAPAKP